MCVVAWLQWPQQEILIELGDGLAVIYLNSHCFLFANNAKGKSENLGGATTSSNYIITICSRKTYTLMPNGKSERDYFRKSDRVKKSDVMLSVVVPFFNEEEVLPAFHKRLTAVLDTIQAKTEIVYINDGSTDNSQKIITDFTPTSSPIRYIRLSRNFGKEAAMTAGLRNTNGQAVVLLDADLQDPPELIPQMLTEWKKGYDVVNMQRAVRHGETAFKRFSAASFYKLINLLSDLDIPENVGDFRLLSHTVVEHINTLPEKNRYMKGLFSWPGFVQTTLTFDRDARFSGKTKWNYFKLLGLAMNGISSFSIRPLRIATVLGTLIASVAFLYGFWIVVKTLALGEPVQGYPSLMVVQLGLGGVQLLCIGLLGEYIGRIFIESKGRPAYVIDQIFDQPAQQLEQEEAQCA